MDTAIIVAIIGAIESIGICIIGGMLARSNKNNERYRAKREKQDAERKERDYHIYNLLFSVAEGTEVLLHQAHGDHLNGNVEEALGSIRKAKADCNENFNKHAANLS